MLKKIPTLIVALLASISLSGIQALSASATTTTDATISSTDFVVPGGTNTSTIDFTVNVGTGTLQDLFIIASDNVSFTGIGIGNSYTLLDFRTSSTNTVAAVGATLSFPNGGYVDQLEFHRMPDGYSTVSQSNTFMISTWDYPDPGSQIDLSLAPGSIAFGSSGPWEIKVLAFYSPGTSWPPLSSEFQTFTLTEPSAQTPTPTPTPTPANTAVSNDLANTGIDTVPTQNLALFSIGAGVLVLLFAKYRSVTAARNSRRIFKDSR